MNWAVWAPRCHVSPDLRLGRCAARRLTLQADFGDAAGSAETGVDGAASVVAGVSSASEVEGAAVAGLSAAVGPRSMPESSPRWLPQSSQRRGRPAIRHSPCILVSCWGSRGTATDQNARAARARIDLTMRDCKPRSRLSYRPEQGSPCGAAKPIALRPRPDREEGTCHQAISRIPTTRHARNPAPIDQPQETSASTRAVRLTCFSTKANVKAFASRRKTAAFARRSSRERARVCSSPPHPASSLGHLTGTASRPAPNPSISITRAGILRFSFQDVLDTALFNHMLEVFGIPRDHKPLVRIPPLLLPAPGPQADFDELAPVDVYGI